MPGVLIDAGLAGLAGLPVVTTDVPGARDVVVNGETGFVRDPADHEGLVSAVASLCEDASLRDRMGRAARGRCTTRFSLQASVGAWRDLTLELAGSGDG